jgi:hypothetical protein
MLELVARNICNQDEVNYTTVYGVRNVFNTNFQISLTEDYLKK